MSNEERIDLDVQFSGERLDRYIAEQVPQLSRAAVQRLVDDGNIRVNGVVRKASYRLQEGESISIMIPAARSAKAKAEDVPLDIVYEDDDVLVINKPAGMVVHPAAGHASGTLVNAVLGYAPDLEVGGEERPGIVHRLDADTSGLILIAKNDRAMASLQAQFKSRQVKKTYLALIEGKITPPSGRVEAPIGRDPRHRQKMAVVTSGSRTRDAITIYHTIANLNGYTLVRANPETGRTHQIRVHLAFLGFPVVADALYGKKKNRLGLNRHFLHAWRLSFALPSGRSAMFTAVLPDDLKRVLEQLGADSSFAGMSHRIEPVS